MGARDGPDEAARRFLYADTAHLANNRVCVMAYTDQLTGLYDQATLRTVTEPLFAGALREGRPFCILIADIDNLKAINDQYGHETGDEVIVACACMLRSTLRKSDVVARYNGDKFVVFLPNTRGENAMALACRLIQTAEHTELQNGQLQLSIGIAGFPQLSLGIASLPEHSKTIDELLSKADTAMYQIKCAGGNSVAMFEAAETSLS